MDTTPKQVTGVDVSDRFSTFCTVDEAGEIEEEGRVRTSPQAFRTHFQKSPRRVVIEVGTHSPWMSRLLAKCGHEVIVANARMVSLIYRNERKTDRIDAESLARLGRLDPKLLHPIQHRAEETQVHLGLVRTRATVVRARTALINHVRGAVKTLGGRIPRCSTDGFARKAVEHIPESLQPALQPVLESITQLSRQIRFFDKQIQGLCEKRYPETALLREIVGVGPTTALTYRLVIDDPVRFRDSRSVGAYIGLTRRHADSGESAPELRITKSGDSLLRSLLIQAAHYILGPFGPESDLRNWGLAYWRRGGATPKAKKKAAVAVARKLAVLLHRLWLSGQPYQPLRKPKVA